MAELGMVVSVAQTLLSSLECSLPKNISSVISYKSDIEGLKKTIETVQSVLSDAGNNNVLVATELDFIQKLKDAVYDADDVFDEFLTQAELKHQLKEDGSLSEKVWKFFSYKNSFKVAYSMYRDVKKIRAKLNDISVDRAILGLSVNKNPSNAKKLKTRSSVCLENVVGREDDATLVITKLLEPAKDVSFLSIVGVGGLGKTTLAKLIFDDQRIQSEFPLKLWASVSDQDGVPLDTEGILIKILQSARPSPDMRDEVGYVLRGKKFLLVLDDVWNEDKLEWDDFSRVLRTGGKGSRIVVTTRSNVTAVNIGPDIHELKGLSEINSWRLFEMTAFAEGSKPSNKLVEIGEKIVQKCCNVPLALKVVGSLLCGKPIDKWQLYEEIGLDGMKNGKNEMMSILKFSYDHLEPSLKICFAYCGLFPKGYVINKKMLLHLWEAQGYLVPYDKGQSIKNVGKEHFSLLLQRCFFQDVNKNEFGDVESFKLHDLMHDLSQMVSGDESLVITDSRKSADVKYSIRHLFEARHTYKFSDAYFKNNKIRSYLMFEQHKQSNTQWFPVGPIMKNLVSLRALTLNRLDNEILPDTFNRLLHLRYLNIANSGVRELPNSITELHNLQTLDLSNCALLSEWPKDFCKLVNLMYLYIYQCHQLKCMPLGMSKLSHLRVLTDFFIRDRRASWMQCLSHLEDLKALSVSLEDSIVIHVGVNFETVWVNEFKERFLEGSEHLKKVKIIFYTNPDDAQNQEKIRQESVLRNLRPHPNLESFELDSYKGDKIQSWGDNWATILPNLVTIKLSYCNQLQQLPDLSKLPYLKSLRLNGLAKLERVDGRRGSTYFPSLESLEIHECHELSNWEGYLRDCAFPRLSQLSISRCPRLLFFPACPILQTLSLRANHSGLRIITDDFHTSPSSSYDNKLSLVAEVDNVDYLEKITPQLLTSLYLTYDSTIIRFKNVEIVLTQCYSSLRSLEVRYYGNFKSVFKGLEYLNALDSLTLQGCKQLTLTFEESDGMPWKSLCNSLRSLTLDGLPQVNKLLEGLRRLVFLQHLKIIRCFRLNVLPKWSSCFESLQSLHIENCGELKRLPKEILGLTSLQKLKIYNCPWLREIYQYPTGSHWGDIEHIPHISIP